MCRPATTALALSRLMRRITGEAPKMWGPSIGCSPRTQSLTVCIITGFTPHDSLMKKLGKHKSGKSCLYFKRLEDVDLPTLERILEASVRATP
jgi:hypothetical protein